jgi:outer membrane protein
VSITTFHRPPARTVAQGLLVAAVFTLAAAAPGAAQGVAAAPRVEPKVPAAGRKLTLEDAIQGALAKNEAIRIQRVALDSAKAAVLGARGAYDPVLAVEAGWQSVTTPVNSAFSGAPAGELAPTNRAAEGSASLEQLLSTGALVSVTTGSSRATTNGAFALLSPAYQTQIGAEVRQPLLRNRSVDAARLTLHTASADRDKAAGALRQEVIETVAAVERAYWGLVAAQRAVGVEEDTVALATRQLTETQARVESGASPETEVAQPRAELERRRGDLLATREAAARAETALKQLILGDDAAAWAERLDPVDEIAVAVTGVDVGAATKEALANRPEVKVAESVLARRRIEAAFAHDQLRPALDFVASYDRYGLAGSQNPAGAAIPGLSSTVPAGLEGSLGDAVSQLGGNDFHDSRVALQLQIPIGNRTARADARIADDAQAQAEAGITQVRKTIRAEVLDAAAAVQTAGARIEAAHAAREAAEVQLAAEEDRFKVGLSTNFLVLTRQNDLASARLAEIEALTDYRTARTEMARATGSLLEERRIDVE